ncbi:hypothetical protein H1235_03985 [Pseudoxanthomonas sp. NC8]|nr:hypothetical protein H1235_03985 [Pseudoxanthomonas sp. NC8]
MRKVLLLFIAIELLIALYGAASVNLIAAVAAVGTGGTGTTALVAVAVLGVPTLLMGMTLPVLVIALDRRVGNIGDSTGTLYFINTVGGAAGAFASGLWLFHSWTSRRW